MSTIGEWLDHQSAGSNFVQRSHIIELLGLLDELDETPCFVLAQRIRQELRKKGLREDWLPRS